jgi:hypothetical protein
MFRNLAAEISPAMTGLSIVVHKVWSRPVPCCPCRNAPRSTKCRSTWSRRVLDHPDAVHPHFLAVRTDPYTNIAFLLTLTP